MRGQVLMTLLVTWVVCALRLAETVDVIATCSDQDFLQDSKNAALCQLIGELAHDSQPHSENRFRRLGRALAGDLFLRVGRPNEQNKYGFQDKRFLRFGRNDPRVSEIIHKTIERMRDYDNDVEGKKRRRRSAQIEDENLNDEANVKPNNTEQPAIREFSDEEPYEEYKHSIGFETDRDIDEDLYPQEKRQVRVGSNAFMPKRYMHFGRGNEEKRFMRFGRSVGAMDAEKRFMHFGRSGDNLNAAKRFMRFGRSGDGVDAEKRFMRFGRSGDLLDAQKRFMRFGRSGEWNKRFMRFGRAPQLDKRFMRFGRDHIDTEKRFMRFGRTPEVDKRFMRFGRTPDTEKRFMRFGREPSSYGKRFMRFGRMSSGEKRFMRFGR